MRAYETMFILAPTLDAEGTKKEVDAVKSVIESVGGAVTAEKEWGRSARSKAATGRSTPHWRGFP
jgi:ribosomal protein S6